MSLKASLASATMSSPSVRFFLPFSGFLIVMLAAVTVVVSAAPPAASNPPSGFAESGFGVAILQFVVASSRLARLLRLAAVPGMGGAARLADRQRARERPPRKGRPGFQAGGPGC